MKYFPKLVGNRLYLSPLCMDDAQLYVKWFNDEIISINMGIDTKVMTMKSGLEWLKKNQNEYSFGIVLKEGDELIGHICLSSVDLIHKNACLKVFVGEDDKRGHGYGKEAIKLMLEYGFDNLNLNNIMLKVYSFNVKAVKLYESLGFKKFGVRHKSYCFKDRFYDEIYLEILKSEYKDFEPFIYV